jgi:nitrite reductase/ring-hydroxylating ferredoxin subunit
MPNYDYDVVIVGSGFGGSVALTGTTLMCQCHCSRFDVTTGAVIDGPATEALNVYEVQEVEDGIQVRV